LIAKYLSYWDRYAKNTLPKLPLDINFNILKSSSLTLYSEVFENFPEPSFS
jgi:hypothetical protein